jgi:hypothetical protein
VAPDGGGRESSSRPDRERPHPERLLTEGYALLSNRLAGGEPLMLEVPLAEALSSDRLGDPTARLQSVLTACAGA